MTPYANHASGVRAYQNSATAINVEFADGRVYVYDHKVTGRAHVEQMKRLAREGRGLATYISQHVGDAYAARFERDEVQEVRSGSGRRRPPST